MEEFSLVWILGLYLLNAFFMLIIAIREVRRPANALIWLIIDLILPGIGFAIYLSTSNPMRMRRIGLIARQNESDTLPASFGRSAKNIAHGLRHLTVNGLRISQVQLLTNGIETFEKLIVSLQNAQKTIDLEYYIYRDDQIGNEITDLLVEKAEAGLRVRFMRDGWGSRQFPRSQLIRMIDAGIECRTIFPLRFPWILSNWNYRDHCKIVMIDGKEAFTGGINVGYEYTGLKPDVGFWRDTHLRIKGEASIDLQSVFNSHWNIASPERFKSRTHRNLTAEDTLQTNQVRPHKPNNVIPIGRTALSVWSSEAGAELCAIDWECTGADSDPSTETLQKAYVQTLDGNPGISTPIVQQAYFICITQAAKSLDITTPYFVPDIDIIAAIKSAAARGVCVRLLVPRRADHRIVSLASRTYYGELLEAGVQIYLYNKGILHAKLMIIDGDVAEVGAANCDMRSFRLNYEVCKILYSPVVARQLKEQFERDLADSVPLRIEDLLKRSRSQRIIEQGARLLSPLI